MGRARFGNSRLLLHKYHGVHSHEGFWLGLKDASGTLSWSRPSRRSSGVSLFVNFKFFDYFGKSPRLYCKDDNIRGGCGSNFNYFHNKFPQMFSCPVLTRTFSNSGIL